MDCFSLHSLIAFQRDNHTWVFLETGLDPRCYSAFRHLDEIDVTLMNQA
jgi:hypothetical protein